MSRLVALAVVCVLLAAAPAAAATVSPVTRAMGAVVQLRTLTSTGTGWLVAPGRVVTAAHVVGGAATVTLLAGDRSVLGRVVGLAPDADLALVAVDPEWLDATPLALRTGQIGPGADVYAIGHALGDPTASVTRGIVGSVRHEGDVTVIQTDAAINAGVSGGPLLDDAGRVAGVLVSKAVGGEGIGHAVEAGDVRAFLAAPPVPVVASPASARVPPVVWPVAALAAGCVLALLQHRRRTADDEVVITLGPARTIHSQERRP